MNKHKDIHCFGMDGKFSLRRIWPLIIDKHLRINTINIVNSLLFIFDGSLVQQNDTNKVIKFNVLIILDIDEQILWN